MNSHLRRLACAPHEGMRLAAFDAFMAHLRRSMDSVAYATAEDMFIRALDPGHVGRSAHAAAEPPEAA
jgi:hypothetical protein